MDDNALNQQTCCPSRIMRGVLQLYEPAFWVRVWAKAEYVNVMHDVSWCRRVLSGGKASRKDSGKGFEI